MTLDSSVVGTVHTEVFRSVLSEESEEVLAIDFDEEATEALIEVLGSLSDPPRVRVLARKSVLKWIRDDFVVASAAAELRAAENLELRTTDEGFENVLLVTGGAVVSIVAVDERVAGLVSNDTEFVASVRERWNEVWQRAEAFDLRTPARSRVEESLAAECGPEVASDFRTVLDALETTRGTGGSDGNGLTEVGVSLLVAANHGEQLYEISKWGEDVGVASKATFSRTKTQLEDCGVVTTEKVPIDVGRPRLRLRLGTGELRGASAEEVASVAHGLLSRTST